MVLVNEPVVRVLLSRFDYDIVRLIRETFWLRTHQGRRDELALTVLEAEDVALGEVEGVLERLEGEYELRQLHVLVQKNVLHFAAMLGFESVHLLFCSGLILILLLHFF